MRVLYLHQYFNTPEMPGGTRSYEMARRLVSAGHEVHMVTSDRTTDKKSGWRVTTEAGIKVHWLPVPYSNEMSYADRIRAFVEFAVRSGARAATIPGDVIFATSTPLTIAIPATYAARRQRIPMVFEVRDLWPEVPIAMGILRGRIPILIARLLENLAYRNSRAIVALSPDMKQGVVHQGYSPENVHVIPNSCDLALFQVSESEGLRVRASHQWLGDRPLVLYTGTFGRVNGVDYLVRLAAETKRIDPDVRFLAVGSGVEVDEVIELSRTLGVLNENFFVMPPVPKKAVPALLSAATLATSLVMDVPALWANSANKVFDAMAAARPVAINYEGWQATLLRQSGAGIVLPATDITGAAHQLVDVLHNQDWLTRARKAALHLAQARFNRDQLAEKLENVLLAAANN